MVRVHGPQRDATRSRGEGRLGFRLSPSRHGHRAALVRPSRAKKNSIVRQHQLVQTFQFLGAAILFYGSMTRLPKLSKKAARRGSSIYWGQEENVWRIEFQVRGPRLKRGRYLFLDDLQNYKPTFSGNSRRDIPTLRRPSDDGNRSRWPFTNFGAALLRRSTLCRKPASRGTWTKSTARLDGISGKQGRVWICREQAQIVRYLKDGKKEVPALETVLGSLPRLLKKFHDENEWHDAVKHRVKAYGSANDGRTENPRPRTTARGPGPGRSRSRHCL